ncbi:hypothetical protein [Micromonospora fiedleri]|nr:hypothetical protein [Micromonospora fiedleri]
MSQEEISAGAVLDGRFGAEPGVDLVTPRAGSSVSRVRSRAVGTG